jgi:hypothetical protein
MPKARETGKPQINGAFIYGSLPIEAFPVGETGVIQMPLWIGNEWRLVRLVGEGIIDITFEDSTDTLYFASVEGRAYATATADSITLKTEVLTFTADAVLA